MNEVTVPAIGITQEVAKAKINIALTEQNIFIQNLHNEAAKLVYNEDNIPVILAFINKVKSADKIIDEKHKEIKKPYKEAAENCDAVKNALKAQTALVVDPVSRKYTAICQEVLDRKKKQEEEERKEREILEMIDTNIIEFSSKIALCETNEQLLAVERNINAQKSPSSAGKYGKFHAQAMQRYDETLLPVLKDQKEKIKENIRLAEALKKAEDDNDVLKIDELQEKQSVVESEIRHNQIKVQENVINSAPISRPVYAKEVIPDVKVKRTTWSAELVDVNKALKESKMLLDITLNKESVKGMLAGLKAGGSLNGKTEVTIGGIRYFETKLF